MDSNYNRNRMRCLRDNPASRSLCKSMEESLFLEDDSTSSRVEAYNLGDIAGEPKKQTYSLDDSVLVVSTPNADHEDFHIMEMVALRNLHDFKGYNSKTDGFRAFFIRQRFSWATLSITNSFFQAVLSDLEVTLQVQECILYFGDRQREVEIVPPRLKYRVLRQKPTAATIGYEYLYCIRFFENNGRGTAKEPTKKWSMRQTGVYNRFVPGSNGATWVFVALSKPAQCRLDDYVRHEKALKNADPFDIHLLLLDTALSNWRPYLVDLSEEVDEHTVQISGMSPDDQGPISLSDAARRQELMLLDGKLLDALLIARATISSLNTLRKTAKDNQVYQLSDIADTQRVLHEQTSDLEGHILQLETLRTKLLSASTLLSSFLDLGSGLALQNLAQESRQENEEMRRLSERMHELTKKATRDAAAVKVLTILTLIYLPATVVSNFFSTSFVGTKGPLNHITVSNDWWIFVAVSIPLTIFTLYVWHVWKNYTADGTSPVWWRAFTNCNPKRKARSLDKQKIVQEQV